MTQKNESLVSVRCECGQFLGKFNGRYDVRCHKCKRIITGDTNAKATEIHHLGWPKKLTTR